ncbi:SRR1-like protein [Anneissia japonica]|uniref:SRR1-like protein n=1 Tax=Anneissia japonica TaxID=1529436 RepID=UPI00142578C6|nr:SRR1-like protein [Anneissia japonica]XP_033123503.1 SRR1-like protein [Anneissia japonica]XP_033123504.1 SRR1-like protein [Anneissia japonica]XP_033123505.1 SRR1-like protein [Anneissia japonica]XP_033123506.1 SRR1-like protein [Anneissia japonica]XP_033123507.1 SRR1-like protein [Anneissia japonica]
MEEFQIVKRKRKKTKPSYKIRPNICEDQAASCTIADIEKVIARIKICKEELKESCFWLKFKESVERSLEVTSSSYRCQQGFRRDEPLKEEEVVPCITDKLSSLTIKNQVIENCEEIGNPTNACQDEDNCEIKIRKNVRDLSREYEVLVEATTGSNQEGQDQSVHSVMQSSFSVDSIVCYGLGNFSSCVNARYQLALLLLLLDHFQIAPSRGFCYDPVFTTAENDILKRYDLSCLKSNEEGKRRVYKPTIFFMPHCGKPLYNNLLWCNWGNSLANLIIIGNSFQQLEERFPSKVLEEEVPYIKAILPFVHQVDIVNNFKFLDVFNDIGVHVFPTSTLQQAPPMMWTFKKEPSYSHLTDVEIIVNKS